MSSNIPNEIEQATRQLQADVKITHDVTHGDENTEIAVDSGTIPTLRKRLKDIEQDWAQTADPLADDLADTVQVTKGYKNAAAKSATDAAAELGKVQQEGATQTSNVNNAGTAQLQSVNDAGVNQTSTVNQAGATQLQSVTDAGTVQTQSVNDAGADQLQTVNQAGIDNLKSVNDAGAAQTGAVNDAGADRLQEITEAGKTAEQAADETKAIADQFGDVAGVVDEATAQADRSKSEADRGTTEAGKATSANNSAQAALSAAEQARDDAVAIVHNDEGSVTPKGGAYPVADSKGNLDIGWTPLLAAMYPYSGVIGSVDKGDSFRFYTITTDWANRIMIRINCKFNIAGRLIETPINHPGYGYWLSLPEAESTADRAIAFDDIFLDWNGNVQTYRSITPHRTTTGYDRDAIATEHGYSKVQTGLYKTGETYALLLGRVARRNKGAYHPVFNPEGARAWNRVSSGTSASWHMDNRDGLTATDAFVDATVSWKDGVYGFRIDTGYIGSTSSTKSGRCDGKYYDAIYADDFTPLYYSAKNVIDRQALLFDSFNRAVAGETFSGAEGTWLQSKVVEVPYDGKGSYIQHAAGNALKWGTGTTDLAQQAISMLNGDKCLIRGKTSGKSLWLFLNQDRSEIYTPHADNGVYIYGQTDQVSSEFNKLFTTADTDAEIFEVSVFSREQAARPQFLMTDIIGSLEAMPPEFLEHGIPGNLLAVGEEGESYLPPYNTPIKLSRKCLECYQVLFTVDKGNTWVDWTSNAKADFESASNAKTPTGWSSELVMMVFYRTSANPFELADNAVFLGHSEVLFNAHSRVDWGSAFTNNLINKTPISGGVDADTNYYAVKRVHTHPLPSVKFVHVHHEPLSIVVNPAATPSIKSFAYLNGEANMQVAYKEIKYNGSSYGDDNKFSIVDKQSTVTDLNGETVIVGQKKCELPFQFNDGDKY